MTLVENGESEHAAESTHAGGAVGLVGAQDDLGVRLRSEARPGCLELASELTEVVDLAVEHDPHTAVIARHGLVARREIDDGEPPMAEPHRAPTHHGLPVGSPMGLHARYGAEQALVHGTARDVGDASDAAHIRRSL